jgi:hypothetical protein
VGLTYEHMQLHKQAINLLVLKLYLDYIAADIKEREIVIITIEIAEHSVQFSYGRANFCQNEKTNDLFRFSRLKHYFNYDFLYTGPLLLPLTAVIS